MNEDRQHGELIAATRELLDNSARDLDAQTVSQLRRARSRAVNRLARFDPVGGWFPSAAVATVTLVVLAVVLWKPATYPGSGSMVEDIEVLSSADTLDIYQDLDFYQWLASDEHKG